MVRSMSLRVARASTVSPVGRTVHRFSPSSHGNDWRRPEFAWPVLTAVTLGAAIVWAEPLMTLASTVTLGVMMLVVLQRFLSDPGAEPGSDNRMLQWMMVGFGAHLLFGLAVTYNAAALMYLGGDAIGYHIAAKWMLEFGQQSLGEALPAGKEGYFYLLAGLYRIFGPHMEAGLALNATLGAALVPLVSDSTRRLFGPAAARRVAPIVVLMPSFFLFTSQLLKEASILFLFAVATNAALRILDRVSLSATVITAVSLALLFTLRAPVALVGGTALLVAIVVGRRQVLSGLTTGLTTFAVLALMVTTIGIGATGVRTALERSNLAESNRQRAGLAHQSNSAFGADVDTGTARQALAYLPVALTNFLIGPFPWQVRGLRQLPVLVDVIALWMLWPSLFRGVSSGLREKGRRVLVLLLPALTMAGVLSLAVGNYGVLMRERMQVIILLVPFIGCGMAMRSRSTGVEPDEAPAPALPVPA